MKPLKYKIPSLNTTTAFSWFISILRLANSIDEMENSVEELSKIKKTSSFLINDLNLNQFTTIIRLIKIFSTF